MSLLGPYPIIDAPNRPPHDWLIPGVALRGEFQVLQGRPGDGKSLVSLSWALQAATRQRWAGWDVQGPPSRSVVYGVEDNIDTQATRLWAAAQQLKVTPEAAEARVFAITERGPLVEKRPGDPRPRTTELYERILKEMPADAGLVVFDPLISLHRGMEENSNDDMQWVADALRELARATNTAVLGVHHVHKNGDPGTIEGGRGASAIPGAARHVIGLCPMTHQQGMEFEVDEEERCRYVQVVITKSNHGARTRRQWLKQEVVLVGQHEAPVWTPWHPPGMKVEPVGG